MRRIGLHLARITRHTISSSKCFFGRHSERASSCETNEISHSHRNDFTVFTKLRSRDTPNLAAGFPTQESYCTRGFIPKLVVDVPHMSVVTAGSPVTGVIFAMTRIS